MQELEIYMGERAIIQISKYQKLKGTLLAIYSKLLILQKRKMGVQRGKKYFSNVIPLFND